MVLSTGSFSPVSLVWSSAAGRLSRRTRSSQPARVEQGGDRPAGAETAPRGGREANAGMQRYAASSTISGNTPSSPILIRATLTGRSNRRGPALPGLR